MQVLGAVDIAVRVPRQCQKEGCLTILDDVTAIVAAQLERKPSEVGPDTDLADEGFTSLDLIEVVFVLEEKFGIDIKLNANDQETKRRTIGDLASLVQMLVERRAPV